MALLSSCSEDLIPENVKAGSNDLPAGEMNYVFANKTQFTDSPTTRAGAVTNKRWQAGQTIKIKFLQDGNNTYLLARNKVKEIANEWLEYANLDFEYVSSSENADVKIAFNWNNERVVWSKIGTDCRAVAQNAPSMNLVLYLNNESEINTNSFKAAILREFGHVLGLINEHQGPNSTVKLDATKARNYFAMQGWTDAQITAMLEAYNTSTVNSTVFDEESIMLWYFPGNITQNGMATRFNYILSPTDKYFIKSIYPGRGPVLPQVVDLTFELKGRNGEKYDYPYTGVRIGEYYWVNNNFYHRIPFLDWGTLTGWENNTPITQARLNRYVSCVFIDPSRFQVDIAQFDRYYGIHYCRSSVDYMSNNGKIYENGALTNWELPSYHDYRQLFAMSPFYDESRRALGEIDVRFALSAYENSNPLAFNIWDPNGTGYNVYWFLPRNEKYNIYNFNMMPSGSTLNGPTVWYNGLGPIQPGGGWDGVLGDIYHLFYTSKWHTKEANVVIHDYLDTANGFSYHWLPVRWCRKLTDEELGYKLYVNNSQTDIRKMGLNDPVPAGYRELEKGYLRGFYVQYILDNPNPKYTIADIVEFSRNVADRTL